MYIGPKAVYLWQRQNTTLSLSDSQCISYLISLTAALICLIIVRAHFLVLHGWTFWKKIKWSWSANQTSLFRSRSDFFLAQLLCDFRKEYKWKVLLFSLFSEQKTTVHAVTLWLVKILTFPDLVWQLPWIHWKCTFIHLVPSATN